MTRTTKILCPCSWYQSFSRKYDVYHKNLQAQSKKQKWKAEVFNNLQVKHNLWLAMFMPYIRGSQNGLDSEWWLVSQVIEVEAEVWKYFWLWTCYATWAKEMQESHSLEWWFLDGAICFLVHAYLQKISSLDTIWSKYEDFCKPQENEVRARFDLLTSFRQGNRSVDELLQCSASTGVSCQAPRWNCKHLALQHILVLLEGRRVCVQTHKW